MADEAKNKYESQIYALRAWLNDEDNSVFIVEADMELWLEKMEAAEDWLYDDGSDLPYTEYKERSNDLTQQYEYFNDRKEEYNFREHQLPAKIDELKEQKHSMRRIREMMPWITEEDRDDLLKKYDAMEKWLEEKMLEQESKSITEEPAFTSADFEE